ncbi:MAG: hypothetical protein WD249_02155 [Gaiellaceae bacterium]
MDLEQLESVLAASGEPAYRARQVWAWAARGAPGYEAMTDVPAALRAELAARVPFSTLTVETEARSRDGTVKTLFRTADGHPVEAVLMRYRDGRRSLCLSSQPRSLCTFNANGRSSRSTPLILMALPPRVSPGESYPVARSAYVVRPEGPINVEITIVKRRDLSNAEETVH